MVNNDGHVEIREKVGYFFEIYDLLVEDWKVTLYRSAD